MTIMVDVEQMLQRREAITDEISQVIGRLGVLVRQELKLQETLRKHAEWSGSKANAFSTSVSVVDAINGELTSAGLSPRRSDPRLRLSAVVDSQNRRYRAQMAGREPASGQSAA
jgi:hypothetical protein